MRIIQLIQKPQLRGAEIFACQLATQLNTLGHSVLVITIFLGDAVLPYEGRLIRLDRPISRRLFDPVGWKMLNKIIQEFQPDILQANAADTLKFAAGSKFLFSWKQPLVYRNANKMGDFINSKFKWHLNNLYLKKVAYVISVSKECKIDFVKIFKYKEDKIEVIEIGVEDKEIGGIPEDIQNIFDRGKVIVHIGSFVPEKNHSGLIRIFRSVLDDNPDIQLLLIGKGKLEKEIRTLISELGLENNVNLLGYRTDVLEILKSAQVFVLPSLIEGLPGVILEAMYCGTPVVVYDVGGVGEVVQSNFTGWLVEKNDIHHFRENFIYVLNQKKSNLPEVSMAMDMVKRRFLINQITDRFINSYSQLLK